MSRNIDLSPKLKLGIGRKPNSYNFIKYSGFFLALLGLVISLQAIIYKIQGTDPALAYEGQVLSESTSIDDRFFVVSVSRKDNLYSVGQKYDVSWTTLAEVNNLQAPFILKDGQKLKIPKK